MNDNTDVLLPAINLEQQYYSEGYEEGAKDGKAAGLLEGKQFGIQTGFHRYLALGVLRGRVDEWKNDAQLPVKAQKHLGALSKLLDDLPMTNSDEDAASIEKILLKASVKGKMLQAASNSPKLHLYNDKVALQQTDETIEELSASFAR